MAATFSDLRQQAQRLVELGRALQGRIATESSQYGVHKYLPSEEAANWDARARALLSQPLLPHTYLQRYEDVYRHSNDHSQHKKALGIVGALVDDIDDGHLPSVGVVAHALTLSDLLDQVDQKKEDESIAAVMLAGGVLEAHLRFVGESRGIPINGESAIGKWNEALCTAGAYDRSMRHTIEGWANMRNKADHLIVQKFEPAAVQAILVGIRTLMQTLPQ